MSPSKSTSQGAPAESSSASPKRKRRPTTPATPAPSGLPEPPVAPSPRARSAARGADAPVDNAAFVREDAEVPDGKLFAPGQTFQKTWVLRNTGSTAWGPGYRFACLDDRLGAPDPIAVPACGPGEEATFVVPFVAPKQGGGRQSTWRLANPQGQSFGDPVWTQIVVDALPAAADPSLAAPAGEEIVLPAGAGAGQRLVATTWNHYGGYILRQANALSIDPAVAVAVLAVESGGEPFGPDGRIKIRFENHIFYAYWGKQNPARYVQHFSFNQSSWAENHVWRPETGPDAPWRPVHVNDQAVEWQVFEFARQLDERAALYSISMGAPQVMGFNHASIGYPTPQEMFVAFQDVQNQLGAMFRFMEVNRLLDAVRSNDYVAFARSYNGPGNPEYYGGLIGGLVDVFRASSRTGARGARPAPTAPAASPRAPRSAAAAPAEAVARGAGWDFVRDTARFLTRPGDAPLNEATSYGVTIEPAAAAAGAVRWQAVGVRHLSPGENMGKHNVFVEILDEQGRRVHDPNLRLQWGWQDQRPDEASPPRSFDKPDDEPATNLDLYHGQHVWVRIVGDGNPSDTVRNLHTDHQDEGVGNTLGHHSYYVVFQRRRVAATGGQPGGGTPNQPPTQPPAGGGTPPPKPPTGGGTPPQQPPSGGTPPKPPTGGGTPPKPPTATPPKPPQLAPVGLAGFDFAGINRHYLASVRDTALNDATSYGAGVTPANARPDAVRWQAIGVYHLRPDENRGRHNVFVEVLDEQGRRVRNPSLQLQWGWEGQRSDEPSPPKAFDKGDSEPATNLDVYRGQHTWVRIAGDSLPSDTVTNLHTDHRDEGDGNTLGHHSYYVVFQRRRLAATGSQPGGGTPTQPPGGGTPTQPPGGGTPSQPPGGGGVPPQPPQPPAGAKRGNKLGFYLHLSLDQDGLWEAIRRVQPPVILIHADTANTMLLQEIRRFRAPNAFVIGRMYLTSDEQRRMLESSDPEGAGRGLAERILNYDFGLALKTEGGRRLIDAWMSLNEAVPGPASSAFRENPGEVRRLLASYDRFQAAFRARLQEAGVEAIAFNFAAGNFTQPEHYLENFPRTLSSYVYLGFHEYGWPTLYPAAGSATGALLYRPAMAAMRARHGDRLRAIVTEAGLTRAFQNPTWGDVGWLNREQTLTEEQYWQSLAWYNQQLLQDSYVLGACLFEVGHFGGWESFRHLGRDNANRPLGIVDRIVALNAAPRGRGAAAAPPPPAEPAADTAEREITVRGHVRGDRGAVAGAIVRLIGGQDTLGAMSEAAQHTLADVVWTRRLTEFAGTPYAAWKRYVAQEVSGISWPEFRDLVGIYNPALAQTDERFAAGDEYVLPENPPHRRAREIVWDRPLRGFNGSLYDAWRRYVENKVTGLTYDQFKAAAAEHNPALAGDDNFRAAERYMLPRNADAREYAVRRVTGPRGAFVFDEVPAGLYRIEVTAPGHPQLVQHFSADQDVELELRLTTPAAAAHPAAAPAATGVPTQPRPRGAGRGVAPSPFVRAYNGQFVLGNQPFRFVGVNVRGLVHYGDRQTLEHADEGQRQENLRAAYDMGARVVRVFLPSIHANADQVRDRLRSVLNLVKGQFPGLFILPALTNNYSDVPFRVQGDEGFYGAGPDGGMDLLSKEFFTGGYERNYLALVRRVVEEFRAEPAIFAWEIGNELKLDRGNKGDENDPNPLLFIDFNHTLARTIRAADPNHLIGTGMISTRQAWLFSEALKRRLYGAPEIDFVTVHAYQGSNEEDDGPIARGLNKPFIIEEAGFDADRGENRRDRVAGDMQKWYGLGAAGYMQWGFVAGGDNGDGDTRSGMDRFFHGDWDALFGLYRQRADELAQSNASAPPIVIPDAETPVEVPEFAVGQTVFAQTIVNVRKSAGYVDKPADDVRGQMATGGPAVITGAAVLRDDLTWWPLRATLIDGATVDGWAAQVVNGEVLLAAPAAVRGMAAPPPPRSRGARRTP